MNCFKILAASAALFTLSAVAVRADLTIVQEIRQPGQEAPGQMTMKVKGNLVRSDVNPQMSVLIDVATGETTTLMHTQKVAMKIPGSLIKAAQEQAAAKVAGDAPKPKATGLTETINGFACEQYTFTHDGHPMEVWVTKDLKDAAAIFAELTKLAPQMNPLGGAFQDSVVDGFPVRTIADLGSGGKVAMTLVSVNQDPIPAVDLEVPKDYKAVEMPRIPGQ